jgi:TonB family protein
LRITSDPAKRAVDVSVVTSSGFECLDDAALRATRTALESLHPEAPIAMTLPVEFRLR